MNIAPGCNATLAFVRHHATLFEHGVDPESLAFTATLREGAPLIQMLEAPEDFVEGSAEPWIVDILCALLKASDQRSVLETGAFVGATSARLARTLVEMGGGKFVACEIDVQRALTADARIFQEVKHGIEWAVMQDDVLRYLASISDGSIGFAWVDDDHAKEHVRQELELLIPKMAPKGLICGHDVYGVTDLQEVFKAFGGYALDLPMLGPAGGLGILQV